MKILILKQNLVGDTLDKGLAKVSELLKSIDFPHEFIIKETTRKFTPIPFVGSSAEVKTGYQIDPKEILDEEKKFDNYDVVALIFDPTKYSPQPTNPTDNGEAIQLPSNWYTTYPEIFAQFFLHELCHERFWATNKKDITHDFYTSAYSQKQPIDYYLYLLKMLKPSSPKYEFFSPKEVEKFKLVPQLWEALDKARKIANTPFIISSGYRTIEENKKAGGKPNSAHLRGLAVDINCDNFNRGAILNGLLNCGTPLFIEDAVKHIHADIDSNIHKIPQMMVEPNDN